MLNYLKIVALLTAFSIAWLSLTGLLRGEQYLMGAGAFLFFPAAALTIYLIYSIKKDIDRSQLLNTLEKIECKKAQREELESLGIDPTGLTPH